MALGVTEATVLELLFFIDINLGVALNIYALIGADWLSLVLDHTDVALAIHKAHIEDVFDHCATVALDLESI